MLKSLMILIYKHLGLTPLQALENLKKQIENLGGDLSEADLNGIITMFSQGKGYFGKDNVHG